MRLRLLSIITFSASLVFAQPASQKTSIAPTLSISKDHHHLRQVGRRDEPDRPFFWLGDTAWELFHRCTRADADVYLKNRADKGFTVIQAVVLAEFDGLTQPNPYGALPLQNNDPTRPNEAYFKHVDYVVNKAAQLGLFIGMVPTWGDKFNKKWGVGPEIFTPENARIYGEFLGKRYRSKPIIWILGGDRNPESDNHKAIIRAMAEGLEAGHGGTQLVTYHPSGDANSATFFHADSWLDLNMVQSGHGRKNRNNYGFQQQNYQLSPAKPTLDGEPRYEEHPIDWKPEQGYFNDFDARQAAYWAVLSGGCGHTYGNHNIWQFLDVAKNPPVSVARTHWQRAMDQPGAFQVGYLRRLMESHPWQRLIPDQTVILNDNPEDGTHQVAARDEENAFLMAYTPYGRPLTIDLSRLKAAPMVLAYWFNPRDGRTQRIGEFASTGRHEFKPYAAGLETDWVLVIDDARAPFARYSH